MVAATRWAAAILLLALCGCETASPAGTERLPWGVFVGMDAEKGAALSRYRLAVIDGAYWSAGQIAALRRGGTELYSYLNIGSLETFRDYYQRFADHTLGEYENWPDERWMDVSYKPWQDFVVEELAAALVEKGIGGFFVDNAGVHYYATLHCESRKAAIYEGLATILAGLHARGLPIIVNGGDTFVREFLRAGNPGGVIAGVNQECVFTSILDYGRDRFGRQNGETRAYWQAWLAECRAAGLRVHLTEYMASPTGPLAREITNYCRENGFSFYIAPSLRLDGD